MNSVLGLLFSKAGAWLAGMVALVLAVLGVYAKGKRAARQETALEAAERMAKTRKRMDDAETDTGDDPAVLRDWLRDRGQREGDL